MKTLILLTLCGALSFIAKAQTNTNIVIGVIDSLPSKILDEKRKIWVHVPDSYRKQGKAKQRYPVVYLLDGDSHFASVVSMIDYLSTGGNTICPEMIVVGIPNTDRLRDLTPTLMAIPGVAALKNSGGGEKFTQFWEKELFPYIEAHYPAEPYRLLIGHSLGGLMAVNTLVHHPNLFNAYIAIDPSMWWDKQKLLNQAKQTLASRNYADKALFVGIANTMESGMDTLRVQPDTSASTAHIRAILALDRLLKTNKQNGLQYEGKYYDKDTHGSVPLITEYDGLHSIFSRYAFTVPPALFYTSAFNADSAVIAYYKELSQWMGYTLLPSESLVNAWGYQYLGRGEKFMDKSASLFKLNVSNYPDSYNVYDSYGDCLMAQKDTANAIINFQKSLVLKERFETRQKLVELQQPKLTALQEKSSKVAIHVEAKILQTYVGVYEGKFLSNPKATFTVTREGDRLFEKLTGGTKLEVLPETTTKFFFREMAAEIEFIKDASGKVV